MSDMFSLDPLSCKEIQTYKKDFERGSKIMKDAAQMYAQTTEPHKKEQLKKSMSEALEAMNEIINNVLHGNGEKYEKKLTADYQKFLADSSNANIKHLNNDIKTIERHL